MTINPTKYRIDTDDDLLEHWQRLMGRGGFGRRSLWIIFLDEHGDTLPQILPIDDVPLEPDELLLANLPDLLTNTMHSTAASSVAFLLSRPGSAALTDADRGWAVGVMHAVSPPMRRGLIHLATADRVRVLAPDDLTGAGPPRTARWRG